jgi:hypothetical protein
MCFTDLSIHARRSGSRQMPARPVLTDASRPSPLPLLSGERERERGFVGICDAVRFKRRGALPRRGLPLRDRLRLRLGAMAPMRQGRGR